MLLDSIPLSVVPEGPVLVAQMVFLVPHVAQREYLIAFAAQIRSIGPLLSAFRAPFYCLFLLAAF
jgi:hypothetical protein